MLGGKLKSLSLAFCAAWSINAAADCDPVCQKQLVERYFELLDEVYKKGSEERDIENLFTLFHPAVKYEHLEYGADFGLKDWKDAFMANLEREAYAAGESDRIKITGLIHGKRHAAAEYQYGSVSKNGEWVPKDGQGLLALFGFRDGRIVLVREYW